MISPWVGFETLVLGVFQLLTIVASVLWLKNVLKRKKEAKLQKEKSSRKYSEDLNGDTACAICLMDFEKDDELKQLPCDPK